MEHGINTDRKMVFVFSVFKPCFIRGPVLMYHRARSCRIMPPFAFHCIVALLEGTPFAIIASRCRSLHFVSFHCRSFHFIASLQTLHATNATMQRFGFPNRNAQPFAQHGLSRIYYPLSAF